MNRPALSATLSAAEFSRWYWLKAELVAFCRAQKLPASGSKLELAKRISAHLDGQAPPPPSGARRAVGSMPDEFALSTVIGANWRCSQALRVFFVQQIGPAFHFNAALREFIAQQQGSTLEAAIAHYRRSLSEPPTSIAEQFEYNRHMREYHASNPRATRAEAVKAWWAKRGSPTTDSRSDC